MTSNFSNFFNFQNKNSKIGDFQDLDHLDGLSISTVSANLYNLKRDDLVLFYFRNGANFANTFTQSKIVSENIKWNQKIKKKQIKALLVNTRNANAFTGREGYQSLKKIADSLADSLTRKQLSDDEKPVKIRPDEILFACTGTIGEKYPVEKILNAIPTLVDNIKYTQNKYVWTKAAMGILTTDLKPKMSMEECMIGNKRVKIYGIAKGSGMIYPNMATTLGFVFTDAKISSGLLKNLLKKNLSNTFNSISCDGDTSTNDMVSIFSTSEAQNAEVKSIKDKKLIDFQKKLNAVLLNLAKSVVADGEGCTKFVSININKCKTEEDAKLIAFSIANSPLVKTAIFGEDPNWGRILMALGKSNVKINPSKISLWIGDSKILEKGEIFKKYDESYTANYMKGNLIEIILDLGLGSKSFKAYTMDLSKKYVEINSDYRS